MGLWGRLTGLGTGMTKEEMLARSKRQVSEATGIPVSEIIAIEQPVNQSYVDFRKSHLDTYYAGEKQTLEDLWAEDALDELKTPCWICNLRLDHHSRDESKKCIKENYEEQNVKEIDWLYSMAKTEFDSPYDDLSQAEKDFLESLQIIKRLERKNRRYAGSRGKNIERFGL